MKRLITTYTFNAVGQTITFPGYTTMELKRFLIITNVVSNVIIYNFADPVRGGFVAGNVLTLDYSTVAMNNADELQIFYEEDAGSSTLAVSTDYGEKIRAVPAKTDRISFAKVIANGVDSEWGVLRATGTGMAVNQTAGNLVITTGTTINSETIIRSNSSYIGGVRLRSKIILSQRIVNQSFFIELVDVVQDAASITINSAVSVTVTFTTNPFTSQNVGNFMYLGNYSGTGTFVPGRYAIASVSGSTVTYTVAGFAAGSGTCSVFGWNYYHVLYDGTVATSSKFDTQRKGWALGDSAFTINTTASPGHAIALTGSDAQAAITDAAASGYYAFTSSAPARAFRTEHVPDDANLFVQIRVVNGTVAPASTTTWTVGFVAVGNFAALDTVIQDMRAIPTTSPLPMAVTNTPAVTVTSGTITATATSTPATGTTYNLVTTASTNAAFIKASAGSMYEITISNPTATPAYVKLFNKTTAPTVGTDVPVLILSALATATTTVEFGPIGKRYATGIAIAVTGAIAAADATNAVAGVLVNATYI